MAYSPKEIVSILSKRGLDKVQMPLVKLILLSFLAGSYIAFGGLLAIKIGGGIESHSIGIRSFVFGAVFPVGLMFVVIAGGELFTGNTALLIPSLYNKKTTLKLVLKNWLVSYLGNCIGAIFIAYFFVYLTNIFQISPWLETCQDIALVKVNQDFHVLFLKAIACNWLVCLAIWLATASIQISGKLLGIWFPIMAFVAIGFEHSIANMFFIPLGIFYGSEVSWLDFLVRNIIPVTLGNIIGGSMFVGLIYSFIYSEK